MDYLQQLGLVKYRLKSPHDDPSLLGVSFSLTDESRRFCQAVAEALGLNLVEGAAMLHWAPDGDITLDPQLCLASADAKRQLWQQLYSLYDVQHSKPG
ncbi:MAG: hypothetical protein VX447_09955 [Pseudomonadota bacterium]|uniref:hypothetical protein n=1 Tax=Gallaecimonas pentaromativorans TaxID=584787 RepID=UPI00067E7418|nr:hypothetical protein [Gallaecimonas pentaromativorans]MED5525065.1 hypothetical protein [Pseudomonadota bacterium]